MPGLLTRIYCALTGTTFGPDSTAEKILKKIFMPKYQKN